MFSTSVTAFCKRHWNSLAVCAATAILLVLMFYDGIADLIRIWTRRDEYSHGFYIPFISLYLGWRLLPSISSKTPRRHGLGVVVVLAGILLYVAGELSTLLIVVHYAMVLVVVGITIAYFGIASLRVLWAPLALLLFMIPLPQFLYMQLSNTLQAVSSQLGVEIVRLAGISVFLEGNIIDLGTYQLQVVEACDGLRYLFPLMSFGFLCAYLYSAPVWQRAIVFSSTIPITVLMNGLRIGVTGYFVEHFGQAAADGFLHYFEGWVVFMACVALLIFEIVVLNRLTQNVQFSSVFGLNTPVERWSVEPEKMPGAFTLTLLLMAASTLGVSLLDNREEVIPARTSFVEFPKVLGEWRSQRNALDSIFVDALKLTDYVLSDFQNDGGDWVNLYVVYYDSQREGEAVHSPRACIPGGGWEIKKLSAQQITPLDASAPSLTVNRVEIQKGRDKQLVYYWFSQRGRLLASEYLVKAYLLWDAISKRRTDGALVRLTTMLQPEESWADADRRLMGFTRMVNDSLASYLPN